MIKNKLKILQLQSQRDEQINALLDEIMEVDLEGEFMMDVRSVVAHQDPARATAVHTLKLAASHLDLVEKIHEINDLDLQIARLQLEK